MSDAVIRAVVWQDGQRWRGHLDGATRAVSAASREACVAALRRKAGSGVSLTIEVTPELAGVAEVASIMGWDKRRVITYLDRGSFPPPIASLAATRVWRRDDVEAFSKAWHRQLERRRAKRA